MINSFDEIKKSLEEIKDLTNMMMKQLEIASLAPQKKFNDSEISLRN